MRDYLYIWHTPQTHRLIISGLHFQDMLPHLASTGGIILLRSQFDTAKMDPFNRLETLRQPRLPELAEEDIYAYGDFVWADYAPGTNISKLSDKAIAQLAFFAYTSRPLTKVHIPAINNRFLYSSHDDGWYLRLYYKDWQDIDLLLHSTLPALLPKTKLNKTIAQLAATERAFWCRRQNVIPCEGSEDIDAILTKRLPT